MLPIPAWSGAAACVEIKAVPNGKDLVDLKISQVESCIVDTQRNTRLRRNTHILRGYVLAIPATLLMLEMARAGDVALGEYLSNECVSCHQLSGKSAGGVPPIVGLSEDDFISAMEAYKSGERNNEVMRTIANGLSIEDLSALAAYLATQTPKNQ